MPVKGAVDGVIGRFVIGWAHDPAQPELRLELEVELDGRVVASGAASLERSDLRTAGIGDGRHGFRFELPRPLEPGSDHLLAVRALRDGTVLPLANDYVVEFEEGATGPPVILRTERVVQGLISPSSSQPKVAEAPRALIGFDGWLFDTYPREVIGRIVGREEPDKDALDGFRRRLVERQAALDELGVPFVIFAVPDKASTYRDQLREGLAGNLTRTVELIAASLYDENRIELVDLLPALRYARRHGLIYTRTGPGLTWLGAFRAYRAVVKEIAKRLPDAEPMPAEALELGPEIPVANSLVNRERVVPLGREFATVLLDGAEDAETEADLGPRMLQSTYVPLPPDLERRAGHAASLLECGRKGVSGRAVVFHDGSAARIASLIAEHFASTLVVVSEEPPYKAIDPTRVAVVVQLASEAMLCRG